MQGEYDHSASLWDFQANDITTTGEITGGNTNFLTTEYLANGTISAENGKHYLINANNTTGTITLPTAAVDKKVKVSVYNGGTVSITANTSDNIHINATGTTINNPDTLDLQNGESVTLIANNTSRWHVAEYSII